MAQSSNHGASATGDLQLVPVSEADDLAQQLQVHAGTDFHKQISLLRAVGRQEAKEQRAIEKKEEQNFREHVEAGKDGLYDVDFQELRNDFADIRTFKSGPILDVHIHRDACSFVQQRASVMAKESKDCTKSCEKMWAVEHELITSASVPAQAHIPTSAKATFCSKYGGGRCLCKGEGYVARLGAHRLGDAICRRSPEESKLRALLKAAWIVLEIAGRWFHIGLQYYRPRRPTLLEMELVAENVWGCRHIRPLYDGAGNAKPITAYKLFRQLDLREGLEVRWYKLVTFDRALPNWRPDRLLLIKPLNEFIDIQPSVVFWSGEAVELEVDAEKRRKAALAAASAREREKQSGIPNEKKPRKSRAPTRKNSQHEAAKARRAQCAEQQLLPLPAPPLESGTKHRDDDDIFAAASHSSDEEVTDGPAHNFWSDDSDIETLLVNLARETKGANSKAGASGASGGVEPDWLHEIDFCEEDVFGPEELPSFEVRQAPDPGESDGLSHSDPFSGYSVSDAEPVGPADGDDLFATPTPTPPKSRPVRRRAARGPGGTWTDDRSREQPNGCVCRRYEPIGETPFWHGELPEGICDSAGHRTRRRGYRTGLRTEAQALANVEAWLHIHSEGGPEGETEIDANDSAESSSTSSESSDS